VPAPLSGAVPGSETLQDDALDIIRDAGVEQVLGVGPGEPANDATHSIQRETLDRRPPVVVRPIDQQLAVEPEHVEGPEGHRDTPPDRAPPDPGYQAVELRRSPGPGHQLAVKDETPADPSEGLDPGDRPGDGVTPPGPDGDAAGKLPVGLSSCSAGVEDLGLSLKVPGDCSGSFLPY
jgi:hypothetical protein